MAAYFSDNRGSLVSYKGLPFEVKEILDSRSYPNVLRGLHMSPYPKRIYIRKGHIYDFYINRNTGEIKEVLLKEGEYLDIPAFAAHGFYTYEYSEVLYLLGGKFDPVIDRTIYWNDPTLELKREFPQTNLILSEKDKDAHYYYEYDYIVLGANGFLGSQTVNELKKKGFRVFESNIRLDNLTMIKEQIQKSNAKYVICAAGISGKPTIEWCETHEEETYQTNYVGITGLMKLTNELGVHCVIYGSGQVFQGTLESYTEETPADLTTKVYAKWRTELEKVIPFYQNVLYLRIIYPISLDGHPKCFLSKMIQRAKTVHNINVNLTIIPSLFPLLSELCEKKVKGILNFVNPGQISLPRLLELWSIYNTPLEISNSIHGEIRGAYSLTTGRLQTLVSVPLQSTEQYIEDYLKNKDNNSA